ncbi:7-cyano-7-deazaguanine synthase [Mycobacterium paraintracellulare]|uniref:7-cyano-7-deazaguanine synthase n=1 Tax=Mycobacterium paraintracellulare TaxID=1138383 RepID=UPI001EEF7783|nr:7-cyano-7-deazaguanine synthase [Mycobacterium paraintracellulare]WVL48858.1 7-cyano-7-deazaguanine synthase [Mycobacterium paraintracellulare]
MKQFAVVVNDCAAPPIPGILAVRSRTTEYGDRNFALNIDDLVAGLPDRLDDVHMDWLEILGFLFATDLVCERGEGDVEWTRSIDLWLPVRDPEFWEPLRPLFEQIWNALTNDSLRMHFEQEMMPAPRPRQGKEPLPSHDCVALLSGGQDSFVGALQLISEGRRPLLLSHTASGAVSTAQKSVESDLRELDNNLARLKLSAGRARNADFPGDEPSQRSRTFLFVGVAALFAALAGSQEVLLNENGIMAVHVPMTAARIGSLSTHTASPPILDRMATLANCVFEKSVTVDNYLVKLTKPEVVARAVELGHADKMINTVSCWQIGRTRSHCGICSPCIMRRISNEYNNVADISYDADIFDDPEALTETRARDNLTHFISLVQDLQELSDVELQYEYPELLASAPAMTLDETIQLHRRWADQAASVLYAHPVPAGER